MGEGHHVAWKDRLGLNRVWEQDILVCSSLFRNNGYIDAVDRFRNNMINIHDGPQLKDVVDGFVKGELKNWKDEKMIIWMDENKGDARIPEIYNRTKAEIDLEAHEHLYNFMLQTLEDNGFCFYQSKLEEDEIM
jgi:hypothetical protein